MLFPKWVFFCPVILTLAFVGVQAQIPGDINSDGTVDHRDAIILHQNWKQTEPRVVTVTLPNLPQGVLPMNLIRIRAGSFMMGSPDTERDHRPNESPLTQVTINYDFYIGETEVTQAQWAAIMGSNPAQDFGVGDDYPVYYVNWVECQDFLDRLSNLHQGRFRLPSAAEWEYACRGGTTTRFFFGNSLGCDDDCMDCEATDPIIIGPGQNAPADYHNGSDSVNLIIPPLFLRRSDYMWFCGNSGNTSHPVRQLRPNPLGLFDMAGNVNEWCLDYTQSSYVGTLTDGRPNLVPSDYRVLRGGSWASSAGLCRSAGHSGTGPGAHVYNVGLRVVRQP